MTTPPPIEPNSERTQPGGSAGPVSAYAPTTAPAPLPTDLQLGEGFAFFRKRCAESGKRMVLCDICHRPIVTKSTNLWAAHWSCVIPRGARRVEMPHG